MKIGELAARAGTLVETIRFYEREGLLPAPSRSASNYRVYDESHVERLGFIRRCRSLDMTLDEIRVLLDVKAAPEQSCQAVNTVLDEHIGHVGQRIAELQALQEQLRALRAACPDERDAGHCGILAGLSGEGALSPSLHAPATSSASVTIGASAPAGRGRGHVPGAHGPGR
ncbi:Cd(II)/Pb(II)-responsive transcriptional regulator [uncultured Aquabacterium sp.]|jgi:Cd(II)/Pb(II)-responsive transcriptional regulator|uniref:Cd(II)/Pb(II)-responsive transcriptional regulator n=1 Tax=uncultured Aquabacterium sp. TaxID=158753 RepID=UPI00260B08FB|nr:Cd(II)/Pb(II)-responsive transcriptional regulator [uncultured Aquabacterium sp.]